MVCKRRLHGIPRRSVRKAAGRRKTVLPAGRAGVLGGGLRGGSFRMRLPADRA